MKTEQNNRLVLGTAQLGMEYGLANRLGKPNLKNSQEIVEDAWRLGVREFDTAQAYGESESVLGKILNRLNIVATAKVITKPNPIVNHLDKAAMKSALKQSLSRLCIPSIYCYMIHREEYLDLWDKGLGNILRYFVENGFVEHIGISVYNPERALQALIVEGIDFVQLPTNVLDHRFEKLDIFTLAQDLGKKVYVRSIFLQGILLMEEEAIPPHMAFAQPVLNKLRKIAGSFSLSCLELALGYVKNALPDTQIIVGVESADQIRENMIAWQKKISSKAVENVRNMFNEVDDNILDPSMWLAGLNQKKNGAMDLNQDDNS